MIYSVDDSFKIDYIPYRCPICYYIIWRGTSSYECKECEKQICFSCFSNIIDEGEYRCPLCRNKSQDIIIMNELSNVEYEASEASEESEDSFDSETNNKCNLNNVLKFIIIFLLFMNIVYMLTIGIIK